MKISPTYSVAVPFSKITLHVVFCKSIHKSVLRPVGCLNNVNIEKKVFYIDTSNSFQKWLNF